MVRITTEEWLSELTKIFKQPGNGAGKSAREIADLLDVSMSTARNYVRDAIAQGHIAFLGRVKRRTVDGSKYRVPVYGPVPKEVAGK